jgi:hypothetical protein
MGYSRRGVVRLTHIASDHHDSVIVIGGDQLRSPPPGGYGDYGEDLPVTTDSGCPIDSAESACTTRTSVLWDFPFRSRCLRSHPARDRPAAEHADSLISASPAAEAEPRRAATFTASPRAVMSANVRAAPERHALRWSFSHFRFRSSFGPPQGVLVGIAALPAIATWTTWYGDLRP